MNKKMGLVAIAVLVFPVAVFASEFRVGNQPSVQANERILTNTYLAGGTVTSAGTVTGDVVAGGGNIVLSGPVGADVLSLGGNISILSAVAGDVRALGGNVVIEGKVGGDVVAGGGQITLSGLGVGGDVALAGGNIRIDAPVRGNVHIAGGAVYINSSITGNVQIQADTVTLGKGAVISGSLTYTASKELTKEDGSIVKGKVDFTERPTPKVPAQAFAAIFSLWLVGKFLSLLVCSLLLGLVLTRWSKEVVATAVARPWTELGRGLITLAALPVLSVLMFVTIIGAPLGFMGVISFIALMIVSWAASPLIVGSVVYRYFSKRELEVTWKTILLGVCIYMLVGLIPFIGGLAKALLMLLSLGIIVSMKWEIAKQWK